MFHFFDVVFIVEGISHKFLLIFICVFKLDRNRELILITELSLQSFWYLKSAVSHIPQFDDVDVSAKDAHHKEIRYLLREIYSHLQLSRYVTLLVEIEWVIHKGQHLLSCIWLYKKMKQTDGKLVQLTEIVWHDLIVWIHVTVCLL